MSIMISEVAAEALTSHENRFVKIETELVALHGEIALLKWMTGFAIAPLSAISLKLFLH